MEERLAGSQVHDLCAQILFTLFIFNYKVGYRQLTMHEAILAMEIPDLRPLQTETTIISHQKYTSIETMHTHAPHVHTDEEPIEVIDSAGVIQTKER